jgi:hypothetical protein
MGVVDLLELASKTELPDETGCHVQVGWQPGLRDEHLDRFEKRLGYALPPSYRQFLGHGDGCDFYGLSLLSASEVAVHDSGIIGFHNWGNGDFDCLKLSKRRKESGVFFMNHNPGVLVRIADTFFGWLQRVFEELCAHGTLAHPRDYRFLARDGVYSHVLETLRGVDCELNLD